MAKHTRHIFYDLSDIEDHLKVINGLLDLVHETSNKINEFERLLSGSLREAVAAYKLATKHRNRPEPRAIQLDGTREILSIAELALELGVTRQTIYNMRAQGRLPPPFHITKRKLGYRRSEIQKWIKDGGAEKD